MYNTFHNIWKTFCCCCNFPNSCFFFFSNKTYDKIPEWDIIDLHFSILKVHKVINLFWISGNNLTMMLQQLNYLFVFWSDQKHTKKNSPMHDFDLICNKLFQICGRGSLSNVYIIKIKYDYVFEYELNLLACIFGGFAGNNQHMSVLQIAWYVTMKLHACRYLENVEIMYSIDN